MRNVIQLLEHANAHQDGKEVIALKEFAPKINTEKIAPNHAIVNLKILKCAIHGVANVTANLVIAV